MHTGFTLTDWQNWLQGTGVETVQDLRQRLQAEQEALQDALSRGIPRVIQQAQESAEPTIQAARFLQEHPYEASKVGGDFIVPGVTRQRLLSGDLRLSTEPADPTNADAGRQLTGPARALLGKVIQSPGEARQIASQASGSSTTNPGPGLALVGVVVGFLVVLVAWRAFA